MAGIGTGVPLTFACAKCRKRWPYWRNRAGKRLPGLAHRVRLTGKTRESRASREGRMHGGRSGAVDRQFTCKDCGHVGWSNHSDLERLEPRTA